MASVWKMSKLGQSSYFPLLVFLISVNDNTLKSWWASHFPVPLPVIQRALPSQQSQRFVLFYSTNTPIWITTFPSSWGAGTGSCVLSCCLPLCSERWGWTCKSSELKIFDEIMSCLLLQRTSSGFSGVLGCKKEMLSGHRDDTARTCSDSPLSPQILGLEYFLLLST